MSDPESSLLLGSLGQLFQFFLLQDPVGYLAHQRLGQLRPELNVIGQGVFSYVLRI